MAVAGKVNVTPLEEKMLDDEPLVYASKLVLTCSFISYFLVQNCEAAQSLSFSCFSTPLCI